jgi:cytochrome bd-type quinol oxidase subunit 2
MSDANLIFVIAFSAVICYGAMLFYRQTRERRAEMTRAAYKGKMTSLCFGFAGVLIWFWLGFLCLHYDGTRPTLADESSGRIYSLSNHGHIVFLTFMERSYLLLLGIIAVVLVLCSYILDRRSKSHGAPESGSSLISQ